jgi:L-gulonolactone oxidase
MSHEFPNSRPRVALVGCGWFASEAHIPALRRLDADGRIEVVAVCSRSEASLSRACKEFDRTNLRQYTDIHALLADKEVDVVDLVLPISTMPDAVRASLAAGKHVISEKPCAPTVAAGISLLTLQASLANPPMWAVAENWRFKKTTRLIEEIVKNGEIGTVHFADFRHLAGTPPFIEGWRGSPDYPGGNLLDSGVHFIALLRQVIGEIGRVNAVTSQRQAHPLPVDTVTSLMSFENGAEGSFRLSFAAQDPDWRQPDLSLVGTKGAVYADFRLGTVNVVGSKGRKVIRVQDDPWNQGGVQELLSHVIESFTTGTPLECTPWEALRDVGIIEAMLESSRLGRSVCPSSLHSFLSGCGRDIGTYQRIRTFRPRHLVECKSICEVRSTVKEAVSAGLRVRAMGVGYSWAPHVLTKDVCVRVSGLNRILEIDAKRKTIRVESGVRLKDMTRVLAENGLSLPSLSFISEVTVGGAVATGTHGTSPKWGTLSDFVRSMKVVLASGELKTFGPESTPEELAAARVAIGMLGVIVELEFQAQDIPWVRFSRPEMDLSAFLEQCPALLAQHEHVWAHWVFGSDQVKVDCLEKGREGTPGYHRYIGYDNATWEVEPRRSLLTRVAARAKSEARRMLPGLKSSISNGQSDEELGQRRMSMQYGVPLSQLKNAVECIRASGFAASNPGREIEMKFLKGEKLSHLGPNADGDMVLFNLWWCVGQDVGLAVFDTFEQSMKSIKARPHWGKLHRAPDIEYMKSAYPRWSDFEAVRARFDPGRTFSIFS